MTDQLLCSVDMARFVAEGLLQVDGVVPEELNRAVIEEINTGVIGFKGFPYQPARLELGNYGRLKDVFALPALAGMVTSLLGSDPVLDHVAVHFNFKGGVGGQEWHSDDPAFDARPGFDVQFFYFPHETTLDMGGTLFLPASHTRHVDEFAVARYMNIRGQRQIVCPPGTVVATHHAIWHCGARPNRTDRDRFVVKVRLNRSGPLYRTWDTSDLESPEVTRILGAYPAFMDHEVSLDHLQRLRLWQRLTGDETFDTGQGVNQRLTGPP